MGEQTRLYDLLKDPTQFFEGVRDENWKPGFKFFLKITIILSVATSIVNYLGVESTDISSAYQAQILGYNFLKMTLLALYGVYAYVIEALLIIGFSTAILTFLTVFLHLIFRLMGGEGSILNSWKSACYGVGPCILGGFLPYVSLFAAFYSFIIQFYIGPKVLYRVEESRAIVYLAIMLALTFVEMFVKGTTLGFFK